MRVPNFFKFFFSYIFMRVPNFFALVNELVLAQQGSIDVQRMNPGLAMKLSFKSKYLAQED